MSHTVTVVVGPARCGKTHHLVGQYRQVLQTAAPAVGRALWLAPTARTAAAVRQQLLDGTLVACLDPGVTTFETLSTRVLAASPQPPRPLAPLAERRLLRRVIDVALADDVLKFFAQAARRSSFVDLVAEHFHELKRHGITPAGFARSIGSRGDRRQHEELARLYTDYERLLQEHRLADEEGRHWAARDALATDATLFADLQLVVADGFTDFTHTQREILEQLARRAGRLLISLPGEEERTASRSELFAKSNTTIAELRLIFPKLAIERLACRATAFPGLDHIAAHLFQHPRDVPAPSPAAVDSLARLEIVAAAGVQDEIVQLARNIKGRLIDQQRRTGPARPGDVVVVFRNLRDVAPRVRDVFNEFGIPHSMEAGVPLAATGVLRTLLDLMRLDAENWRFRRVVSMVTNNLLTAAARDERTAAEWLIRDLQIAQGRDKLLERITTLAGELASASGPPQTHRDRQIRAAARALSFLRQLADALADLPANATPTDWIAAFTQLGQRLGIRCLTRGWLGSNDSEPPDDKSESLGGRCRSTPATQSLNSAVDTNENNTAWQEIEQHFASLERLADWLGEPGPQLARDAVLDVLVDLATHESLPRRFDDAGRVRILSAATARTVDAPHVLLAGMSEQAFPSPERPGRLYSEADYRCFANAADQSRAAAELPPVQRSQEEMLLFYEVLTRAGERLTVSYPALDEKAQNLPPSPYVTEVERAVAPATITHRRAPRPSPMPTGDFPLGPADWRIQAVHHAIAGDLSLLAGYFQADSMGSPTLGATGSASALEAALRITASRSRRDAFGPGEGLLESDAVRKKLARRFGSDHHWSPSQWETYAVCPYRFFMEDVLGLEPLGELVLETNHRHRGTLVHRVLAELHRRLPELLGGQTSLSQYAVDKFVGQFENVLEALVRATPHVGVEAALVELDRLQIAKWGPRYHAEHGKYDAAWAGLDQPLTPTYLEWRFGPPRSEESEFEDPRSTSQPFVLDLGEEQIRITGRIDRIDVGESAGRQVFNVIDYKSGKRPSLSKEKIATGERLQPALYVMAAQALLFTEDSATPLYAGYWSLTNGVTVDARYSLRCSQDYRSTSEDWESLRDEVIEQIGQFVHDIRGGDFPVCSRDDDCTSRCEFSTVCRISQVRSLGKQWFGEESDAGGTPGASGDGRG